MGFNEIQRYFSESCIFIITFIDQFTILFFIWKPSDNLRWLYTAFTVVRDESNVRFVFMRIETRKFIEKYIVDFLLISNTYTSDLVLAGKTYA